MKTLEMMFLGICLIAFTTTLPAQTETAPVNRDPLVFYSFNFRDAPLNSVLSSYQKLSGKQVVNDAGIVATLTLDSMDKVTAYEAIDLITAALAKQGLRLEEVDEHTLRVRRIDNPK